jgi:hypothetical protein
MTLMPLLRCLALAGAARARRWRSDRRATAAVEFTLISPVAFMMVGLIVFSGESLEVQRKVTMTLRTLTDLVAQQCDIGPGASGVGYAAPCPSKYYVYSDIVSAASAVMQPYDPTGLQFTIAEVRTNGSTGGAGAQVWCKYTTGSSGACPGGAFPPNLSASAYVVYGNVNYTFHPLGVWMPSLAITFSDSLYFLPRIAPAANPPQVACTGC